MLDRFYEHSGRLEIIALAVVYNKFSLRSLSYVYICGISINQKNFAKIRANVSNPSGRRRLKE